MITIIHGDDIVSSRNYFLEQKEKIKNPISFEGQNLSLTDLVEIFEGDMLFTDDKTIFVENFFTKRKPSKETSTITDYVNKQENVVMFFWEGKTLTKKQAETFLKGVIKTYSLPKSLFAFLDSIKPGNGTKLVALANGTLKTTELDLIFFMLIRQIRLLLAVSDTTSKETIDEVTRLAPWQKNKLLFQAKLFSPNKLKIMYKNLYDIDLGVKTGKMSLPLRQYIDFFLLEI